MSDLIPATALVVALLIDWRLGDVSKRWHPVIAMGTWIAWSRRHGLRSQGRVPRLIAGAASLLLGIVVVAAIGWLVERISLASPFIIGICIQAAVLKSTLSIVALGSAANSVASALHSHDLPRARQQLAYHLVSRDTSHLDETSVAAAAVESVAENTSDSCIAPLFYFVIAGLPGALVYRYVNTCDAMVGYRTPDLEWLGKPAARLDDLLNLLPSRITALLMLVVGPAHQYPINRRAAISIWLRDHRLTASPNAGHPISAAAGLLNVVLEKRDHYTLGGGQALPTVSSIDAANSLLYRTSVVSAFVAVAWLACVQRITRGSSY